MFWVEFEKCGGVGFYVCGEVGCLFDWFCDLLCEFVEVCIDIEY